MNFGISAADSSESIFAPCFSEMLCRSSFTPASKRFAKVKQMTNSTPMKRFIRVQFESHIDVKSHVSCKELSKYQKDKI